MLRKNYIALIKRAVIFLLILLNLYLFLAKAIPGALTSSIDLRYSRVKDFINHSWEGVEEFPSMLCCIFPLGLFDNRQSAAFSWMIANFLF